MGAESGRRAVMGAAVEAARDGLAQEKAQADGEQLRLLPAPIANPRAQHFRRDLDRRDQAGRPPGAVNKSNAELRNLPVL